MMDANIAKQILTSGEYTCVLCKGDTVYTSDERGVKPLVAWVESAVDFQGFSAADKVVGKGAAFLYVLLGVDAVYAQVISAPALALLQSNGIRVAYDVKTDSIANRRGDGVCPFETAVLPIDDAKDAYSVIREKMRELHIAL